MIYVLVMKTVGNYNTKQGGGEKCWIIPCFLYLLLPLATMQGPASETDNFRFSRLAFSWSPSWGAEQTLFRPCSPEAEPWERNEWALLRQRRSRLSQRFCGTEATIQVNTCDINEIWFKWLGWMTNLTPSLSFGWCADTARTWCWLCLWIGTWDLTCAPATRVLLRKWCDVFCAVSLRPTFTLSLAEESRSHRICFGGEKKTKTAHSMSMM